MTERDRGVRRCDAKLPFGAPVIESAVLDGDVPKDVIAEWSGADHLNDGELPATPKRLTGRTAEEDARGTDTSERCGWRRPGAGASPTRRTDVREYPIDDEALVYDPQTQVLYHLNETAFAIWRRCDGRRIEELASGLTDEYDVNPETALDHVSTVVEILETGGLFAPEATDVVRV
jgi:hypothetical protein